MIWKIVNLMGMPFEWYEGTLKRKQFTLSPGERVKKGDALKGLTLYHFWASPFSRRVRKTLAKHQVEIPMRNVLANDSDWKEMVQGGKRDLCPCLKIEQPGQPVQWMYESNDIIRYIESRLS
jgi:hypothetical protein